MNILILLFLIQNEPVVISSYLKQYCSNKGGDGFMVVTESGVILKCKDKNSGKFYINLR